jgi:ABC-type branched-subunit amino acid transport system ATPase component
VTDVLPALRITNLTVRFGGRTAVEDLSLEALAGRITGLIGPNGAGKTTTFNACTGVVTLHSGSIRLFDRALEGLRPSGRAQLGLGRTFQRIELFDTMTVRENVAMGPEGLMAGRRPWTQLLASRRERRQIDQFVDEAVHRCNLEDLQSRTAGSLSTGQRRLVELARAIATPFRVLLLDEPSSGLDVVETEQFGRILQSVVTERGIGILLVEHDMALVRQVCEFAYVLDFGRLIFAGNTSEVLASEVVRAAYLGSELVA